MATVQSKISRTEAVSRLEARFCLAAIGHGQSFNRLHYARLDRDKRWTCSYLPAALWVLLQDGSQPIFWLETPILSSDRV